jgi:predicted transcriptional regulator
MTNREFLNGIIANETLTENFRTHAQTMLNAIDKRNNARIEKPSKTQISNEPIKASVFELLTAKGKMISSEIATALEITTNKASAICLILEKEGTIGSEEIKIPKVGKRKAYFLKENSIQE